MNITFKNFVILLGSLLLTCGALSYAMEENEPSAAGQLVAKNIKERDSHFNELPLEIFLYMTGFLNVADVIQLMQTKTYFYEERRVLFFTKIRSAACQGCWKVPTCDIDDYSEILNSPLPRAHLFSVVSQSDVDLLNCALFFPAGDYLGAENSKDKSFLLAIAMHNKI